MSLRHAMLGLLYASPMSGYELVRYFQRLLETIWFAQSSQIYPELRKMEEAGLIAATVAPRGQHATKRIYSLTEEGLATFERWANEVAPYPPERDPVRLKALYAHVASFAAARDQFQAHIVHYQSRLQVWHERVKQIRARTAPITALTLERRPPEEHAAIVAFKAHAVDGLIARAKAEIAWARRGLRLVDELEATRLAGADGAAPDTTPARPRTHADRRDGRGNRPSASRLVDRRRPRAVQ